MKRAEKTALIDEMNRSLAGAPHVILANFSALTVNQSNALRRRIGRAGGEFTVIKNRLARRAAAGTPAAQLADRFAGPCALATHPSDPIVLAKALSEFSKENPQLVVLAGLLDARELVDGTGVKRLATLPGLPELRAQLLALILTPATSLARLLGTPGTQLARVVDARRKELEGAS